MLTWKKGLDLFGNCESLKESEISHASKVMLKILQARFQQYVN